MPHKINDMNSFIDSVVREGQRGVRSEGKSCGGDQGEGETGKGKRLLFKPVLIIYVLMNSLLLYTCVFCYLFAIPKLVLLALSAKC